MAFGNAKTPDVGGILITDSFNRADNTGGLGVTDTGQSWQNIVGSWQVKTNHAEATGSGDQVNCVSGLSDGTILAKVTSGGNAAGIAFRVVDSSNYWCITIRNDSFSQLTKVVAGVKTSAGNLNAPTYVAGAELKVVLAGSTIQLYYNGVLRNTYTDATHQSATLHGLYSSFTGTQQDDFQFAS